ncbi:MAG: hypothetical protein HS101_10705 [Planctomycetia bacterium]|jgi:hypothetical protein|nr:hypothetical protein [Planctomycetia bacterium]MCC7316437.1 hypothetical protein [Planctomycetota bacterium]OQZ05231.1 MAG: hypothetical protein B6D36_11175 [Planctomycetes bacterium UTPLA1]
MLIADSAWAELFKMPNIAIFMGCMIPIVASVAAAWRGIEKTKSDNALKRSLVERGLAVDEIERVLTAGRRERK